MERSSALEPWHMWGGSVNVTANVNALASQQILRINYARPETWRFFYAIQLPNGTPNLSTIIVVLKMSAGIGRSVITMPQGAPGTGQFYLASETIGQNLAPGTGVIRSRAYPPDFTGANDTTHPIETIVAQDLQVWAEVSCNAGGNGTIVQVSMQCAPNVHIRPEWYRKELQGLGGS